ncbi:MAG: flagellar basal body rod protein FlgC [Rhodospirillaceae bacterium]|jgi:flagellar basal-body rod protein FlgC|nr:flagellar basal body rod protein FlgC [Rhodospirillaceae bacterium]MBT5458900.1 flagellar basal body rod protein FlgC [Rhodospirillaceae bacterium]
MDLMKSIKIAAAGMRVQGVRLKVISENIANADSMSPVPGGDPYRRKVVTFENVLDRTLGTDLVKVRNIDVDSSDFRKNYNPGHPAADKSGYVSLPNVNALVEMMDMREAQRSYEANLRIIDVSKKLVARTVDLLR